jgi:hypothetical protein
VLKRLKTPALNVMYMIYLTPRSRVFLEKPRARSASPRLLWNPKVYTRPPPVPILSHINRFHTFHPQFPNICFNIVVQLCHVADSQIRIKPLIKHCLFATFPCYSSYVVFTTCFGSHVSIIRSLTIYIRTHNHLTIVLIFIT